MCVAFGNMNMFVFQCAQLPVKERAFWLYVAFVPYMQIVIFQIQYMLQKTIIVGMSGWWPKNALNLGNMIFLFE